MSRDPMPQHALPGECVYCIASVERGREATRTLKGGAVVSSATCLRCERSLMRGDAPPVAVACPTCRSTGRETCPECHGDESATAAVSSLPWPLPVPTQAEWDAMPAAEKAVRDAVGQWRRLAVERGAEVERLTAGRDEAMSAIVGAAERVAAERDLYRAALADDARGRVPGCQECERLATLRATERDQDYHACDHHRGEYEWTDAPHAAAIRRALKATEGER